MQPLDLPLMRRLRVPPHTGLEGARRLILKLLLPGVNLVGMDRVALRKVDDRGLLSHGLQRDLTLQPGINPPSRLLRHRSLRLSNGAAALQLSLRSQKPGPPLEAGPRRPQRVAIQVENTRFAAGLLPGIWKRSTRIFQMPEQNR